MLKRLENKFKEDISKMKIYETPAGANDNINQPNKDDKLLEEENNNNKYRSEVGILL